VPVVRDGQGGGEFWLVATGLFRSRNAGYKGATAGLGPVTGVRSFAMRSAGLALLAVAVAAAAGLGQPPMAPMAPVTPAVPPPLPAAVAAPDQKLDSYLDGWSQKMSGLESFRFDMDLVRKDPAAGIFKGEKKYKGEILGMKPNLARLRLAADGDDKDYEAFICNGKSVYAYNGLQRTITEHKLPDPKTNPTGSTDNLILDFMSGMKTKDMKERFDIKLFQEDKYYIYIDIKPVAAKDKQDFVQLKLALYRPGPDTGDLAYLPVSVLLVRPNGEQEYWKLSKHLQNIKNLDRKVFEFENIPGFRFQQADSPKNDSPVRPGRPTPPPARPGKP
jgi:TIGR03009 family protein